MKRSTLFWIATALVVCTGCTEGFQAIHSSNAKKYLNGSVLASTGGGQYGYVDSTSNGMIQGWAYDPAVPSSTRQIHIYIGGPAGQGALVAVVNTDLHRADVNQAFGIQGNHGFSAELPVQYRDGQEHSVFVYLITQDGTNPLVAGPIAASMPKSGTPKGFEPEFRHRRIATFNPDSATYSESCPDAPGGTCKGSLAQGQGFYTMGVDVGGSLASCRVNSQDLFDVPGGSNQSCPFSLNWLTGGGGQDASVRLQVDSRTWTSALTPNLGRRNPLHLAGLETVPFLIQIV